MVRKKTRTLAYQIQGSINGSERDIRNEFEMVSKANESKQKLEKTRFYAHRTCAY